MIRRLVVVAMLIAAPAADERGQGVIDWSRRVLVAHGQGPPDLRAPSIAVARLGAERVARLDAYRNALEALKEMELQSGGKVGTLLRNDAVLAAELDRKLKGVKPVTTRYYSDGGMSLDIELALDDLPADLARAVRVPDGIAPLHAPMESAEPAAVQGQDQHDASRK